MEKSISVDCLWSDDPPDDFRYNKGVELVVLDGFEEVDDCCRLGQGDEMYRGERHGCRSG